MANLFRVNCIEMNNRIAFIDFVRGLLNINPLERWSPQQAKLHPFITQQKYTGQFVPPMNLKSSALNRSPAPGTQQQIQAQAQPPPLYGNNNMYTPSNAHPGAPPPYSGQQGGYGQMGMQQQQAPVQM